MTVAACWFVDQRSFIIYIPQQVLTKTGIIRSSRFT